MARRQDWGFTLVELMVVVVIIGLLAGVGLANYTGAQNKAKISQVKANMHVAQVAAESYAHDNSGMFATTVEAMSPYYPGGSNSMGGAAGVFPPNPFTGTNDGVMQGAEVTGGVAAQRLLAAGATTGTVGQVQYSPTADQTTYAIIGFDHSGKSVAGNSGKQLVLSNQ